MSETIQIEDGWPPAAPPYAYYNAWTPLADPDHAARKFAAQYGQPPQFIFTAKGLLWLGPVPNRERTPTHATPG